MTIGKARPGEPVFRGGAAINPDVAGSGGFFRGDINNNLSVASLDTAFSQNLDGKFLHGEWAPTDPVPAAAADHVLAASGNLDTVLSYAPAGPNRRHTLYGIDWAYTASPTNGRITIEDGDGNVVWGEKVTTAGHDGAIFDGGKTFSANSGLIVRLVAAGVGVSGEISATHRIL